MIIIRIFYPNITSETGKKFGKGIVENSTHFPELLFT